MNIFSNVRSLYYGEINKHVKHRSTTSQGGAKQAKKAAKYLVYKEARQDDADMFDDEDEEDMDHYEDDPNHPWLVPEGRGDSWQGEEDEDSDTGDGDRTVPSFTEPGDFNLGGDEESEEEDEDEDADEEKELPQRPVHVDRPERVRQDFRIRDFGHEVLKKCLVIGKAIRLGKKPHRTTVSILVKRWPEGPRAYKQPETKAMEADREAWLALTKEQRAASDKQHNYAECKRKYVPGTFVQAKAVAQIDKPSQRHIPVYTDFKAHGIIDLLNFVRAMHRLRHLPV
jgi:hypothetical protein